MIQRLSKVIDDYGCSVVENHRVFKALLLDLWPTEKRQAINVLVMAVEHGVVSQLREQSRHGVPYSILSAKCCGQLQDELGMNTAAARRAIEIWSAALGIHPSRQIPAPRFILNPPQPESSSRIVPDPPRPPPLVSPPWAAPPPGRYAQQVTITLLCETKDTEIRYTEDGSEPTMESLRYVQPLLKKNPVFLKARAFHATLSPSDIAEFRYRITHHEQREIAPSPNHLSGIFITPSAPPSKTLETKKTVVSPVFGTAAPPDSPRQSKPVPVPKEKRKISPVFRDDQPIPPIK